MNLTMTKQLTSSSCRHGEFTFYQNDEFVGLSLAKYGEYSEREIDVYRKVLRPGDIALDIGANIGALTVPMSRLVGETGKVFAFEANPDNVALLRQNLKTNNCTNVTVMHVAVGTNYRNVKIQSLEELGHHNYGRVEAGSGSLRVNQIPIDGLHLDGVNFVKIDVEGHELEVIRGMRATLAKYRPVLYVENDREDKSEALVAELVEQRYRMFWHRPPLFDQNNFNGCEQNVFGNVVSMNMVCVAEDRGIVVKQLDEVADIRQDDLMFDREIERYSRYLSYKPDELDSRLMIGHYQNLMQRDHEVHAALEENLRRDPAHIPTHAIIGLRKLQRGNWAEGWPAYELRFLQRNLHYFGGHRKHDVPQWDGSHTDETVLIWSEQGFGDTIMFSRFFNHVLSRVPNAILEVQPELYELFETSKMAPPGCLHRLGRTLPPHAQHCSLPSTPAVLHADEAVMRSDPYLHADPALVERWRIRNGPKIGVCWEGSARSERPFTRDVPVQKLDKLMRDHGPILSLVNSGQFESFADTAAAITQLDLVITVDTSIAHLSGALGVPTWLMLSFDPDWRWGLKDETTIWYDSVRIFRQPRFRDWDSVIAKIEAELK